MSDRTLLFAIIAAAILMFPLFTIPRPSFVVGAPWKVELLSTAFLLALLLISRSARGTVAAVFDQTKGMGWSNPLIWMGVFVLWSLASSLWAGSPFSAIRHSLIWAVYTALLIFVTGSLLAERRLAIVAYPLMLVSVLIFAICLIDFTSVPDFTSSEGVLRIRYAKYAELLVTAGPFLAALSLYSRNRRERLFTAGAAAFGWIAAMLSLSKAAFISGFIGFVILFAGAFLLSRRQFKPAIIKTGIGWIILTVAFQLGFSYFSSVPATTDYITGRADASRSTSSMRIFTWKAAAKMVEASPIIGVGADNFGIRFNEARAAYAAANPDDPSNSTAEDYIVERAHNEYVQILAELGVIGALIFALMILGFFAAFRFVPRPVPPILIGCVGGAAAFLISSLFTSFSFRAMQNGIVFFMVLAFAFYVILKQRTKEHATVAAVKPTWFPVFAGMIAACSLLFLIALGKFGSQTMMYVAEHQLEHKDSYRYYSIAETLDPENGAAVFSHGGRLSADNDWAGSARQFSRSIDMGLGVTLTYSFLAESYLRSDQPAKAEDAMRDAIRIFPRSVFARARLAAMLDKAGKKDEAANVLREATAIDEPQANGWFTIIRDGSLAAVTRSMSDKTSAAPVDLRPENAVYAFIDEKDPQREGR